MKTKTREDELKSEKDIKQFIKDDVLRKHPMYKHFFGEELFGIMDDCIAEGRRLQKIEDEKIISGLQEERENCGNCVFMAEKVKEGIAEGRRLQKIEDNKRKTPGYGLGYHSGYAKALAEELEFLEALRKWGSWKNMSKFAQANVTNRIEKLKIQRYKVIILKNGRT